jgi:hypothetical protein
MSFNFIKIKNKKDKLRRTNNYEEIILASFDEVGR